MDLNLKKDRNMRRKPSIDVSSLVYGKIPPQAKELEEAVLGAVMLEKGAFDTVIEILKAECFYVEAHQIIFTAMTKLAAKSMPVDILTVTEELRSMGSLEQVGGPFTVMKLTNMVVSSANIEAHARIILQKFIQRELIRISGEILSESYEDTADVFDLLDSAESKLFEVTNNHLRKNYDSIDRVLVNTMKRIEDLRNKGDDITGVPSGFPSLDKVTYGWQPTDLIIIAARPSVGKTAFALNLARNAALHPRFPKGAAVFSLEMSSGQIVQRILSAESEIKLEKISRGKLEEYEMKKLMTHGIERLAKAPIFIDDTPALNIFELRAKCRRLVHNHGVGVIIIDYLQLMSGSGDGRTNREQEISKISRDLKGLAKELQVPVIALSQLSRDVEKRKDGNKMPQLSDLRESGAIEQDADMVMFLYRPEYYEINTNEMGESNKGETHVRIAKHRNGQLDTIKLRAVLEYQRFEDDGSLENPGGGNPFAGIRPQQGGNDEAKLYIQKGSRMNDMNFDEGFEDAPF
ncbi:primary replicative DNA helicase [Chitinophaga terrae (ex Kim and Jung 2007)]|uniref:Replicative DNA helicase n=1 Tax=Chitinophaga terrae (ex Kim and Jung 2007) TaxID=408074 RepID=A0A1H4FC28_9BACT|nr:replicative DNA helicase [Chitinophaga terrae (ex Kim and Jung 2007)]MDQ0110321.1 replicative DNA helicase [Chitinophaga terrae (ex Kim and Jung 2007)]GEP92444.1 replicative DNA helicase [Chitinophaga terrae (ex Kim and Jung 2007)]SEA94896.1 primary replicative DNA helicase [Chitinophaga terrae (ex Kim and Jung 2007)]